jgi:hypothetical protein
MLDLPELPEPAKRKPALQWNTLLDAHGLTGEHLQWHANERERRHRVAAICGGDSGRGETAVDDIGIQPSVEAAKARFSDLSGEYRRRWLSSGAGYEVFAAWLDILKRHTSEEVASVWKSRSKAIDRWYKRACEPAVEEALADLVREGTDRARADELKRLERGSIEDALPKANLAGTTPPGADEPARTEAGRAAHQPSGKRRDPIPQFPKRASWLNERLRERSWNKHDVERKNGPHHKTVQKILDGWHVREDALMKLAEALSAAPAKLKLPPVSSADIPTD